MTDLAISIFLDDQIYLDWCFLYSLLLTPSRYITLVELDIQI